MKKLLVVASVLLASCSDAAKTPDIEDIGNIKINGKSYTAIQYIREFCQFPEAEKNMNCFKASKQANADMSKFHDVKMAD